MIGALPSPGVHSTPPNLSSDDFANLLDSACCEAPSTLTAKWLAFWKMESPCENIPRLHSTSGGLSDTDANELQVNPYGFPSGVEAVMMVTPVAKLPSALRKSLGLIPETLLSSSAPGSGLAGCLGASVIPYISKRQVFRWQAKCNATVIGAGRIEIES